MLIWDSSGFVGTSLNPKMTGIHGVKSQIPGRVHPRFSQHPFIDHIPIQPQFKQVEQSFETITRKNTILLILFTDLPLILEHLVNDP